MFLNIAVCFLELHFPTQKSLVISFSERRCAVLSGAEGTLLFNMPSFCRTQQLHHDNSPLHCHARAAGGRHFQPSLLLFSQLVTAALQKSALCHLHADMSKFDKDVQLDEKAAEAIGTKKLQERTEKGKRPRRCLAAVMQVFLRRPPPTKLVDEEQRGEWLGPRYYKCLMRELIGAVFSILPAQLSQW